MRTYTHLLPIKPREDLSPAPRCPVQATKWRTHVRESLWNDFLSQLTKCSSYLKRTPHAHTTEGLPMDFLQHAFSIKLIGICVCLKMGEIYQIALWNKPNTSSLELLHRALWHWVSNLLLTFLLPCCKISNAFSCATRVWSFALN